MHKPADCGKPERWNRNGRRRGRRFVNGDNHGDGNGNNIRKSKPKDDETTKTTQSTEEEKATGDNGAKRRKVEFAKALATEMLNSATQENP